MGCFRKHGQLLGRRAADTLLLRIGRSQLLEDAPPARSGAERALSLRVRGWLTASASRAGDEGRQKPRRSSEPGTTQRHRWAKLAWLAEVKGWNYPNASEFNGTLDRDLESARYALLVKIKGIDYALNRQRHSAHIYGRGTHAIALTPASLRMRSRAEGKLEEKFDAEYKKASDVAKRRIAR